MNSFIGTFRKVSPSVFVLAAIFAIGIFLRTFHFHDWLRFNADQSRDAGIVSDVVEGKTSAPLLGPKAGGTEFRLGSAFYIFQIASASLFGNRPDAMAYPDLISSLLAIPLLYAFLRLYFERKTALFLTALFAVSFYGVKYSRFAWNPNSLPFWTLLFFFSLHRLLAFPEKAGVVWSIIFGVALGVGVQLHTLTLILFPIAAVLTFGYLAFLRRERLGRVFLIVSTVAVLLNAGQILSEIRTGGENLSAFFSGIDAKEEKGSGFSKNIVKDSVCFVQGSVYILTSHEISDTCDTKSTRNGSNGIFFAGGIFLFFGGIAFAFRAFYREREVSKRYFLIINMAFLLLSFLLFIPLANEISMRFFLMTVFLPFILLGLWFNLFVEVFPRWAFVGIAAISSILILANVYAVQQSFSEYASYLDKHSEAGMDNVLLREVEEAADFIVSRSGDSNTVSLGGDSRYLFKALKSIRYFTEKQGIDIIQQKNGKTDTFPQFIVDNTKHVDDFLKENPDVIDWKTIGRFTLFQVRR